MNDGSMTINVPRVCGHTCAECVYYPATLAQLATIAREKVHCGGVIERTSGECLTLMEAQNAAFDAEARALKAEAMCEWLAERLEALVDAVLSADTWLTAAREAVIHTAHS